MQILGENRGPQRSSTTFQIASSRRTPQTDPYWKVVEVLNRTSILTLTPQTTPGLIGQYASPSMNLQTSLLFFGPLSTSSPQVCLKLTRKIHILKILHWITQHHPPSHCSLCDLSTWHKQPGIMEMDGIAPWRTIFLHPMVFTPLPPVQGFPPTRARIRAQGAALPDPFVAALRGHAGTAPESPSDGRCTPPSNRRGPRSKSTPKGDSPSR